MGRVGLTAALFDEGEAEQGAAAAHQALDDDARTDSRPRRVPARTPPSSPAATAREQPDMPTRTGQRLVALPDVPRGGVSRLRSMATGDTPDPAR
jgi:hypothetical protein